MVRANRVWIVPYKKPRCSVGIFLLMLSSWTNLTIKPWSFILAGSPAGGEKGAIPISIRNSVYWNDFLEVNRVQSSRPISLAVRTSGFHPDGRSSNLLWGTKHACIQADVLLIIRRMLPATCGDCRAIIKRVLREQRDGQALYKICLTRRVSNFWSNRIKGLVFRVA